jgi:hypothetical protein
MSETSNAAVEFQENFEALAQIRDSGEGHD